MNTCSSIYDRERVLNVCSTSQQLVVKTMEMEKMYLLCNRAYMIMREEEEG